MTNFITTCILALLLINSIEVKYYENDVLMNSRSDCSLVFENNKAYKCNILDSGSYKKVFDSDSIRISGLVQNHEFKSTWYSSAIIENSSVVISYHDSIPKNSIPYASMTCIKTYFSKLKVTIGNNINQEYFWNKSVELYIDGVIDKY